MSQQEEMKNLAYWATKKPTTFSSINQKSWNPLTIVMWKMTISSNLTALNLPHFAPSLLSQTLRRFIFPTFLTSSVSSQNPSNSTSLATEIMEIFMKTVLTPSGKTWSTCSTLAI